MISLRQATIETLRLAKRRILSRGYARPVHRYVKHLPEPPRQLTEGKYLVNLSFDLEHAYNTPFWVGEYETALAYGERSCSQFLALNEFLKEEHVPYNVQIVGMLLETEEKRNFFLSANQQEVVKANEHLFSLHREHAIFLESEYVDVGLHGYSHRLFSDLTRDEASAELEKALSAFVGFFGDRVPRPTFMSFPRNRIMHEEVVSEYGIRSWRSNRQVTSDFKQIPLGLWFAPGNLSPDDMRRLLKHIRTSKNCFFLHLWNHFTEMDRATFELHIKVLREEGWEFTHVRGVREQYE